MLRRVGADGLHLLLGTREMNAHVAVEVIVLVVVHIVRGVVRGGDVHRTVAEHHPHSLGRPGSHAAEGAVHVGGVLGGDGLGVRVRAVAEDVEVPADAGGEVVHGHVGVGAALLALFAGLPGTLRGAETAADGENSGEPDLVAVRGEDPAEMFDRGIAEFGGIGAFVKRGQKVLIKPNIGWDQPPEMAANTNPDLVRHMVELCLKAGAAEVAVFDNSCDNWVNSYRRSGIRDAVEAAGGVMFSGKQESDYREVEIPGAVKMRRARVHRLVPDSLTWVHMDTVAPVFTETVNTGVQKAIVFNGDLCLYTSSTELYRTSATPGQYGWSRSEVTGLPEEADVTSLLAFAGRVDMLSGGEG